MLGKWPNYLEVAGMRLKDGLINNKWCQINLTSFYGMATDLVVSRWNASYT